ncbi:hypothetical protein GALL_219550 [mine drainage metagenome]|uniref:Membrane-anchored protein n=1 Tax=mine drainage metagenome TaxID=410659 RepID=A0A1J5S710_9ZZZZ
MDVQNTPSAFGHWSEPVKVPVLITLWFWIIKIMATTVGETAADFLAVDLHAGLVVTSLVMTGLFAAVLAAQMRTRRYIPWLYWLTVVLISVVGTLLTDNLTDQLGVSLAVSTGLFALALAATFIAWFAREGSLSIHSIVRGRREAFYWAAILFTFALGTAAGDLAAERLQFGYAHSALLFGGLIALVALAYYAFKANAVVAFWLAYILTRPFGATCGDWLSKSAADGGMGLGTVGTSVLFLVVIGLMVTYLTISRKDAPRHLA